MNELIGRLGAAAEAWDVAGTDRQFILCKSVDPAATLIFVGMSVARDYGADSPAPLSGVPPPDSGAGNLNGMGCHFSLLGERPNQGVHPVTFGRMIDVLATTQARYQFGSVSPSGAAWVVASFSMITVRSIGSPTVSSKLPMTRPSALVDVASHVPLRIVPTGSHEAR